ncbi:hypothetical protein [Cupriavidus sp. PET2-C1]
MRRRTNYAPLQRQLLRDVFGVEPPPLDYPPETWPDYAAPIIVDNGDGARQAPTGTFGMVPKARIPPGVAKFDTTNARSETVDEKRSFSGPCRRRGRRERRRPSRPAREHSME